MDAQPDSRAMKFTPIPMLGCECATTPPSREDVPLIGDLNADDSALRQRIYRVQITTIGTQVACSGLKPGARC